MYSVCIYPLWCQPFMDLCRAHLADRAASLLHLQTTAKLPLSRTFDFAFAASVCERVSISRPFMAVPAGAGQASRMERNMRSSSYSRLLLLPDRGWLQRRMGICAGWGRCEGACVVVRCVYDVKKMYLQDHFPHTHTHTQTHTQLTTGVSGSEQLLWKVSEAPATVMMILSPMAVI